MSTRTHRAEWLSEGSYGLMVHYLIAPEGNTEEERNAELNRIVDAFDMDTFIDQVQQSGADWLIFTIGQNTGYYCSPNSYLDKVLPRHTSQRDLVSEIGQKLTALGKRLIVYLPVEVAGQSDRIKQVFSWNPIDQSEYLYRYLEFVRAYSLQFGTLQQGWWFDGCYPHIHEGKWDWSLWIDAARAGNPDSIVALSDATFCVGKTTPLTPLQDYLGGEVHLLEDGKIRLDFLAGEDVFRDEKGHLRKPGQSPIFYLPDQQYVEGVQWHALVPVDSTFNPSIPDMHYPDEELFGFVKKCKSVGGAVTLNVPISLQGSIPEDTLMQLRRLDRFLREN